MSDPRTLASQALWRAVGQLEQRLETLEASLTALCARLSDDPAAQAAVQRALADEASSGTQEANHA